MQRYRFECIADTLKPVHRRQLLDEVREAWKVSIRKACHALASDPRFSYRGEDELLEALDAITHDRRMAFARPRQQSSPRPERLSIN